MRWKVSHYTRLLKLRDGSGLLYNGLSGAAISVSKSLRSELQRILAESVPDATAMSERSLWSHLVRGSYIVPAGTDELQYLKQRYAESRRHARFLVTILPTFDCNLECSYCFVGKKHGSMSRELQSSVIRYVSRRFEEGEFSVFNVDWLGGEPLLVMPTIRHLSRGFIRMSDKKGVPYSAQVITNGTFLNPTIAKALGAYGVDRLQITIDGTRAAHDRRRPLKSRRSSSFDQTFAGLQSVVGRFVIRLRINVDRRNADGVWTLLELFRKEGWLGPSTHFYPYLARVSPLTEACAGISGIVSPVDAFFDLQARWIFRLAQLGVPVLCQELYNFPAPRFYNCAAVGNGSLVLTPNGEVHKCGLTIDDSREAVTSILDSSTASHVNARKWNEYSPFDNRTCCSCAYLPSCLGGCPRNWVLKRYRARKETCKYHREWEDRMLLVHGELASRRACASTGHVTVKREKK